LAALLTALSGVLRLLSRLLVRLTALLTTRLSIDDQNLFYIGIVQAP
jgi:hypothetical protein